MQLKIVYGAPCSGKSTYVKNHIGDNDIVFDYDELTRALTYRKDHREERGLTHGYVMDFRSVIIRRAREETEIENIWIISTFLTDSFQEWISDMNPEYIKMAHRTRLAQRQLI